MRPQSFSITGFNMGLSWQFIIEISVTKIQVGMSLLWMSVKQQFTYRTAMLAGLATNFFWSLLRVYVIVAMYQGNIEVNQLSLQGAITYIGLSQSFIAFLTIFGSYDLMRTVYSGEIAGDLLKPVHLYYYWLVRDFGRSLVNFLVRACTGMVLFACIFPVYIPTSLSQWMYLVVSLSLAWLVSFTFRFMVNLTSFWSPDARGYARMAYGLSQLLAGMLIPLRIFPNWFSQICYMTPFPSILNTPIEVYLGILQGKDLLIALVQQLSWYVILTLICLFVLQKGIRKLVIQGG